MQLLLQADIVPKEQLEAYMLQHFFQNDQTALGPITYANFKTALETFL